MFLSLNIHEALTFETEICLHPDLFGSSNSSTNNSVATLPAVTSPAADTATTVAGGGAHKSTTTAAALQAGDLVEVRVWDARTMNDGTATGATHSGAASVVSSSTTMPTLKSRRFSPPPPPPAAPPPPPPLTTDTGDLLSQKQHVGDVDAYWSFSGDPRKSSVSVAASQEATLATPVLTPQPSPKSIEEGVVLSQSSGKPPPPPIPSHSTLPPPFPRSRTNTADFHKPPVPPTRSRAATSANSSATNTPRHSPKSRPRHVRDISDMTTESAVLWGEDIATTSNLEPQIVDFAQVPHHYALDSREPRGGDDPPNDLDDQETQSSHGMRLSFFMLVTEASLTSLKATARTQVSLLRQVADLYNLSSYDMVSVHRVPAHEKGKVQQQMEADFVLVTIKDQYLSRGDLHLFQQTLQGSFIYQGQRLQETSRGMQAHAREIRLTGAQVAPTGLVTEHTKIAYRSRSARIFWLVQMSAEVWEYAAPFAGGSCEIYFDKFMRFAYELFQKWKSVEVTHSLTVVFFSRTFLNVSAVNNTSNAQKDVFGRHYEDHCRIVIENETRANWDTLILKMRQAFWDYPSQVGWNLSTGEAGRWPSTAGQGNLLEAINVTLNLLQYHYLDRDLHRTGNSIVVVSAGNGVFEVSKELSQITHQRMMDNGIGSDMLSLGLPPLHTAPFFMYVKEHQAVGADGVDSSESYFEVPHWMHLSFVSYESDSQLPTESNTEEPVLRNQGRIEVGSNGFIRKQWIDTAPNSPLTTPDGISPHGVPTTSPTKRRTEMPKERQLIADREFEDILRASRPRYSAALPSAFRSLLQTQGLVQTKNEKADKPNEDTATSGGDKRGVREWNSMDSDDASEGSIRFRRARGRSLGQDPRDGSSPIVMARSPPRVDALDTLERSTPSSSYTSHASAGPHGTSYERATMTRSMSPRLTGVRLQRARSMEFDIDGKDEAGKDSPSLREYELDQTDDLDDTSNVLDSIRQLMKAADSEAAKVDSPKVKPKQGMTAARSTNDLSTTRSFHGGTLTRTPITVSRSSKQRSVSSHGSPSGGIGAALSQYRGPTSNTAIDLDPSSATISRVSSYGRLPPSSLLRIPEMISAGMSPLLLPPTIPAQERLTQVVRSDNRPVVTDRHYLEPQRLGSSDAGLSRTPRLGRTPEESSYTSSNDRRFQLLMASSPPTMSNPLLSNNQAHATGTQQRSSSSKTSKKKKAFNPFRQQDEDAVLAEKSHNRRRWSHVFPAGEVEFKRHAGPNWKSLSSPAILPLSVDYFPPQAKIDLNFRISQYSINVSDFENRNFSSTKFLLMEMVRQRITQDFQLVPRSNVDASNYRKEWLSRQVVFNERPSSNEEDNADPLRMFLSMGHRLQVLSYVPSADTVHVTQYTEKKSSEEVSYKYFYMSYCQETGSFVKVVQSFQKYSMPYIWNKVDRILSGDVDRELREGMRVKRNMFLIVPDKFQTLDGEEKYAAKFKRLLEYFDKLRPKDEADTAMDVRILTTADTSDKQSEDPDDSTPGIEGKAMVRFYLPLKKGRGDRFEFAELSMDATFKTTWSYRIIINWLAASTTKIDAQVQSLQRRCLQYGLTLIPAPQLSVARNVFLNSFRPPILYSIRDRFKVPTLYGQLIAKEYVHDGVFSTYATSIAECLEGGSDYKFRRWSKLPHGRQFLHRSGTLFVRVVVDRQGWALIVAFANYKTVVSGGLESKVAALVHELGEMIQGL